MDMAGATREVRLTEDATYPAGRVLGSRTHVLFRQTPICARTLPDTNGEFAERTSLRNVCEWRTRLWTSTVDVVLSFRSRSGSAPRPRRSRSVRAALAKPRRTGARHVASATRNVPVIMTLTD